MPVPLIAPIIAGGAALINSASNYFSQRRQAKQSGKNVQDTIAAQKAQSEYAYSKDLEQWERENLYNEPSAQMDRLREAGLNPAMVYGTGGAKTVAATSPKYQAIRPDFAGRQAIPLPEVNAASALNQYQDFKMKNAQIDLVRAQADTQEQEAINAERYYTYRGENMGNTSQSRAYDLGLKLGTKTFIQRKAGSTDLEYKNTPGYKMYQLQMQQAKVNVAKTTSITDIQGIDFGLKRLELDWWKSLKGIGAAGQALRGLKYILK